MMDEGIEEFFEKVGTNVRTLPWTINWDVHLVGFDFYLPGKKPYRINFT